ncbi:hypothetical protein MBLNU230_g8660t1 [Neophaeotheca triangularis]
MAATQPNKSKRGNSLPTLQTPQSGTYPSELRSPMIESPSHVKREEGLKTPITPPSAYLDYLKNMSPALMSPAPTGTSTRFSFNDKTSDTASAPRTDKCSISPPTSEPALSRNGSYDQPISLSRNTSYDSTTTQSSEQSAASFSSAAGSSTSTTRPRPESPRVTIPPSPFAKPAPRSARTPRRLKIPQSPFSPAVGSAQSVPSPYVSTPLSAAPWSASFSPREYEQSEAMTKPGKVSVRQTVTRTVTYCRTPLDPAPKGKRRKVEEASDDSKESSTEPLTAVKQEPVDNTSVSKDASKDAEVIKPPEATSSSSSTTPAPPVNASNDSGTK